MFTEGNNLPGMVMMKVLINIKLNNGLDDADDGQGYVVDDDEGNGHKVNNGQKCFRRKLSLPHLPCAGWLESGSA